MLWPALTVFAAAIIWGQLLPAGSVAQLSPAIVVMFILPGFLVLELAFPALARKIGPLERGPLLFSLSMGVWTLIAAVAYRAQLSRDLVIAGVLICTIIGILAVFITRPRYNNSKPFPEKNDQFNYIKLLYFICLIFVLLIVSGVVGLSAEFQRYDFDSCFHLAGYNKIADNVKIAGGNAFLGPEYSYLTHYIAHPWYLVFGLSARLAHTNVTWLYVCLTVILTPLFFLSFYSLLKTLTKDNWIAIIGALLVIGPWVSKMALDWGPPMGTFYLQFLPFPFTYTQLILFPLWIAYCFRYMRSQTSENWAVVAVLAIAAMGGHPECLLVVPYSIGIVFIVSMFFLTTPRDRIKIFALVAVIVIFAAIIAYLTLNPVGKELWKGIGYRNDFGNHIRTLGKDAWIISPDLYAIHPKFLITLANLKNILGCIIITLLIGFKPKLFFEKKPERWLPAFSISISQKVTQRHLAVAVAAVFAGPYLILYNPVVVPMIVKLLGSAIPIRYMTGSYEVFVLVCKFGAIASILVLMLRCNKLYNYRKTLKLILLIIILIGGIGLPLGRPAVSSMILSMINRDSVSILDLTNDPLYKGLSKLEPGVVAINMEQAEYLVMTTSHYVISSCRMIEERQLGNERIVKFSVTPKVMKDLLSKYDCRYVVVPLDDDIVSNGEFPTGTSSWDAGYGCTIASVSGGQNGNCLQLTGKKYGSQIIYQNITCDVGKSYELKGYVKSGTSGDEPFRIQIFRHNASGHGEFSIDGTTNASWVRYSLKFKANYRDLCVMLRKNSATHGTMLFDTISCHEVTPRHTSAGGDEKSGTGKTRSENGGHYSKEFTPNPAIQRFREHPELFDEILTIEKYAIFEVKKQNI